MKTKKFLSAGFPFIVLLVLIGTAILAVHLSPAPAPHQTTYDLGGNIFSMIPRR